MFRQVYSSLYRTCLQLTAPTEADLDTPEMVEAAAAVERDERDMRVLDRLVELGLELAEAITRNAKACLEAASAQGVPPAQDVTGPYNKMAQTIRRTLALKAKLAAGIATGRSGLATQRAARRATLDRAHREAMDEAITDTFSYALGEDFPDLQEAESESLLDEMQETLFDGDEFKDYLDRPVGETVARLCAAMGLDPAVCVLDGETWKGLP